MIKKQVSTRIFCKGTLLNAATHTTNVWDDVLLVEYK